MPLLKRIPNFIYFDAKNVLIYKEVYEGDYIAKELGFNPNDYDNIVKEVISYVGEPAVEEFNKIRTVEDEKSYFDWFNKHLCEYLNITWTEKLGRKLTNFHLNQSYKVIPGVLETLQKLHGKYGIGVISNALPSRRSNDLKVEEIDKYLSPIIISSEEGSIKPYPKIFEVAAKKAGVGFEDILFIDDKEEFLKGAVRVGIDNVVLVNKNNQPTNFSQISNISELIPELLLK
jgi:HAD superfamily hydrolase (TIGR01509 family)